MKKTTVSLMVDYGIAKQAGAMAVAVDAQDNNKDFDYDAAVKRMIEYSERTNEQYRKSLYFNGGL